MWHHEQAQRMANLWRCVLLQALREDGMRYLDTSDGHTVCRLAGFEPSRYRDEVLQSLPPRRAADTYRGDEQAWRHRAAEKRRQQCDG